MDRDKAQIKKRIVKKAKGVVQARVLESLSQSRDSTSQTSSGIAEFDLNTFTGELKRELSSPEKPSCMDLLWEKLRSSPVPQEIISAILKVLTNFYIEK